VYGGVFFLLNRFRHIIYLYTQRRSVYLTLSASALDVKKLFPNELISMRKEGLVVYFAVMCLHLSGGAEEKNG
jgi:hypothetical protein